jgi:hypothetical protein
MSTDGTNTFPIFDTDEILHYNNGKWGEAGYACPNPGGKVWTTNSVIAEFVDIVGRNLFELAHREDVKFYAPPHKQFWYDVHQLIVTGRKRLNDRTRGPADNNGLVPQHAAPNPQVFLVYPLPYFGERVRQLDVREYIRLGLMLLGEVMQNSDNERSTYITPAFAGQASKYLQEIMALFCTKYFGKTRAQAYAADFVLADADFQAYDPTKVLTSVELTEERPPVQWWPTENDLSQIRGIPINEALMLCQRWPSTAWLAQANGNVFTQPTQQTTETSTQGSGAVPADATGVNLTSAFTPPPGQAP